MMRKGSSFAGDETVIWVSSTLLAIALGAAASYAVTVALDGATIAWSSFMEVLALVAAGVGLIVVALQGPLVRFFLVAFCAVFFIALAVATHGFTAL